MALEAVFLPIISQEEHPPPFEAFIVKLAVSKRQRNHLLWRQNGE